MTEQNLMKGESYAYIQNHSTNRSFGIYKRVLPTTSSGTGDMSWNLFRKSVPRPCLKNAIRSSK